MAGESKQLYKLTNHYELVELENKVLLNPINSCNINKFLVFNGTAATILKKVKNTANIDDIVSNLISTYDISKENEISIYNDVSNFIVQMIELSIIEKSYIL